jgi:hypothetical protein
MIDFDIGIEPYSKMINFNFGFRGLFSKENNFMYVPILKNAHMWGEKFFPRNFGCTEEVYVLESNINLFKDTKFLVILREPTIRWVSALTQYLVQFDEAGEMLDNPLTKKLILDALRLDNHSRPQAYDLIGLNKKNCIFFNCNEDLEKNLNYFSLSCFNKPTESVGPPEDNNISAHNLSKQFLYPKIKNMVDTELIDNLKIFYSIDYTLYNSVIFTEAKEIIC